MKCILHIGTQKTGSSSIQLMLRGNKYKFRQAGLLYPGTLLGQFDLYTAFCADPLQYHMARHRGISTRDEAEVYIKAYLDDLEAEIAGADVERVILSSEDLWGIGDIGVGRLADYLRGIFDSVTVVVYLRHPLEVAYSIFQQRVKGGATRFESWANYIWRYEPGLAAYVRHFGRENMKVRIFDPDKLYQGCVVRDFCHELDIDITGIDVSKANQSMSYEATMLLMALNERIPRFIDNKPNPLRLGLMDMVRSTSATGSFRMNENSARRIMEMPRTRADLEWVESQFLDGEPVFTGKDFSMLGNGSDIPSIEDVQQQTLVQMFAEILIKTQGRIGELEQENARLKQSSPSDNLP